MFSNEKYRINFNLVNICQITDIIEEDILKKKTGYYMVNSKPLLLYLQC